MVVQTPKIWLMIFVGACLFCLVKRVILGKTIGPVILLALGAGVLMLGKSSQQSPVMLQPPRVEVTAPNQPDSEIDSKTPQEKLNAAIQNFVHTVVESQTDKFKKMFIAENASNWMQVESSLCATAADADNEARDFATAVLFPYVKAAIEPQTAGSAFLRAVATDDWLQKQIKSSLERGVGIVDKHLDRIDRPYGTLWKVTLRVDTSADDIQNKFAKPYRELAEAQASGKQSEWLTLAGLIGVIFLLYTFLNSATKGYFVWRLRAVATLVLIAAVLTIFAIA